MPKRGSAARQPRHLGDIERYISELAELWDWRHHKARQSHTPAGYADGFPADVVLRQGRLIFITVAAPSRVLIPPAAAWIRELESVVAVEVLVIQRNDLRFLTRALQPPGKTDGRR